MELPCHGCVNSGAGGGFKYIFIFIPTWGNDPIWRAFVSNGLVQPPTSFVFGFWNQTRSNQTLVVERIKDPKDPKVVHPGSRCLLKTSTPQTTWKLPFGRPEDIAANRIKETPTMTKDRWTGWWTGRWSGSVHVVSLRIHTHSLE